MKCQDKCKCPHCMSKPGRAYVQVMIGDTNGLPVQVGSIVIDTDPLLVEEWMLQRVAQDASKQLTRYVANSNFDKVLN